MYMLLLLASVHCGRSIFFVNTSWVDLQQYENGTAPMPFQGRVAMMPLLHSVHSSHFLTRLAATTEDTHGTSHVVIERATAEKVTCEIVGVLSIVLLVAACAAYGRKHMPEFWWLPPVIVLALLYSTYAARYEQAVWYPYDLPHFLVFTLAAFAILEGRWALAVVFFCLDVPIRETSIYLLPCLLTGALEPRNRKRVVIASSVALLFWVVIRALITHHFAHNANGVHLSYGEAVQSIVRPKHWAQVASAFGFFAVPLWLGRKLLPRNQFLFLLGALPCVLVSAVFGIWYETRVFGEWLGVEAVLLATEAVALIQAYAQANLASKETHLPRASA